MRAAVAAGGNRGGKASKSAAERAFLTPIYH